MSGSRNIQTDSSELWSHLSGKITSTFKGSLDKLDDMQREEVISPFLAETVRVMIHQAVVESPGKMDLLAARCFGLSPKYLISELEHDGYRLLKAAEQIAESSHGVVHPGQIIEEYQMWQKNG